MKKAYLYIALFFGLAFSLGSCSGDYDSIIESDDIITGVPSKVANITSEALPGEIKLKWGIPADSNYYYLQIKYYDFLTEKEITQVASVYTDSLIIPNTRAKYGDYDFKFQTFNGRHEGGEVISLKARSGIAPITESFVSTKIPLVASQLSTNAQEPTEGAIANLLDGNSNTFFHTRWSSPQMDLPHYIDIKLTEPLTNFSFYYQNRNGSQVGPENLAILISNDGQNWTQISNLTSGLPSGSKAEYSSEVIRNSTPFTYLRFSITKTFEDKKYFNMAELVLYRVVINTYDPEA